MDGNQRLSASNLFSLTCYALAYRPVTALLIAIFTVYLPHLAVSELLPAPGEVFSWEFFLWAVRVTPIYSISVVYYAWVAFQPFDGNASIDRLRAVFARLNVLYIAMLIVMVVGAIGSLAFVLPGVIWGLVCTVAIPAAALEELGPTAAIRRSYEMTKGRLWTILGCTLAIFLPIGLVGMVVELALVGWRFEALDNSPIKPAVDMVMTALGGAFAAAVYFELKRLESARPASFGTHAPP